MYFCLLEIYALTVIHVHVNSPLQCPIRNVIFCCSLRISCLRDFTFLSLNLTTWKMLILYFQKFNFWSHHEWVGSGNSEWTHI